jgi:hypothetical protein
MAVNFDTRLQQRTVDESKGVIAVIMAPVNGRLLNFYSTGPYTTETDRTAVEKSVAEWRDTVVAANPRLAGLAARSSIFDGSLKAGVIGGAIGAAVVLIKMLVKKRRPATSS